MKLILLDLISPVNKNIFEDYNQELFLPITPYSRYICEILKLEIINFHDFVSQEKFRNDVLDILYDFKHILQSIDQKYLAFFYQSTKYISYFYFLDNINKILLEYKSKHYKIEYMTDRMMLDKNIGGLNNNLSLIDIVFNFDRIIRLKKRKIRIENTIFTTFKKVNFIKLFKLLNKVTKKKLKYDWLYILSNIEYIYINNTLPKIVDRNIFYQFLDNKFSLNYKLYDIFVKDLNLPTKLKDSSSVFFTFPLYNDFLIILSLKSKKKKIFMYQHGSYFYHSKYKNYKSLNLQINEIVPADINFVFNDYTKKIFEDLGAKRVYSVGSILFNKPIKEKKKKFDFLYITQGHDYGGNFQYVDFPNSLHSFDGYGLYQRHKSIIKLFGECFKNKKIIIRVHPTVVTNGVYVPFWELAQEYKNITIDVSTPIHNLIEKSKYIISDYFTTEFINRELHYKRDIILFQGAPTPLPEETIEDMKKMFILVDTVDDLKYKVENIEKITKNRKRYDDIIEYYSSKKCDTKRVVQEIIKKELENAKKRT